MLVIIPAAETQVKPAYESHFVVDHDEFLMMSPVEGHVRSVLEDVVVGMAHDLDVPIAWGSLGAQSLQGVFGMLRVAGQCSFDLTIDYDIDLYTSLRAALQNVVETPFLVKVWWSP